VKRYLDDEHFKRFKKDFQFFFKLIRDSQGELDLRLRDNYFNIYHRGNSMAKIKFNKTGYQIAIHQKFVEGVFDQDQRFSKALSTLNRLEDYNLYSISPELLHPFLQRKNLNKLASNVKKVNYGEEIVFEQAIITDNMNREEYLIIDRQVTDKELKRRRMDLLGLRQISGSTYAFEVIELKLGNSSELKADVGMQLESYVSHIKANITEWKENYEKVYQQLKQAGLFDQPSAVEINITPEVSGRVIVVGYSGIARKNIDTLKQSYPDLNTEQKTFLL
jgi:hypothetical protein